MAALSLDTSSNRLDAAQAAGNDYTADMTRIRNTIDSGSASNGTSLGTMVKSQVEIVEAETMYQVKQGIPNNVSKAVKTAAAAVKQAAG